ncbi:hypothetical protein ACOMHN_006204 [Nucella lapillus]
MDTNDAAAPENIIDVVCVSSGYLRIPLTQRVFAAAPAHSIDASSDPKDTINAACGEQFLRIPPPWDFTLWTHRRLPEDTIDAACVCSGSCGFYRRFVCVLRFLRIPSTRRVCAASPKDTINEACLCSGCYGYHQRSVCVQQLLRIPSTQRVCAAAPKDTIDAACVCSGSLGYHRRSLCVQRFLRIPSTQFVCPAASEDTINAACFCSGS